MTEPDTKPDQLAKRALIRRLWSDGVNPSEISRRVGVTRRMVYRWKESKSIQDSPRSGRPSVMTAPIKQMIEETIRDKVGVGTRKCTKSLNASLAAAGQDQTVSRSTVLRFLKETEWGCIPRFVKNKPLLSAKNVTDRIRFCDLYQGLLRTSHSYLPRT